MTVYKNILISIRVLFNSLIRHITYKKLSYYIRDNTQADEYSKYINIGI